MDLNSSKHYVRYRNRLRDKTSSTYRFPHPLETKPGYLPRVTYRELYLRNFVSKVIEKPQWSIKMENPEIWKKWILAAKQTGRDLESSAACLAIWTKADIGWAKEELRAIAAYVADAQKEETDVIPMPVIDCVWRADGLVGEELRMRLLEQVKMLEDVPDNQKDWHPGSNGQVLDLVHPSMYPLCYGRTTSLDGNVIRAPRYVSNPRLGRINSSNLQDDDNENDSDDDLVYKYSDDNGSDPEAQDDYKEQFINKPGTSKLFQWLPSNFSIVSDGSSTSIKSYINNLSSDREKREMYPVLEEIFTLFIPLFESVLSDLWRKQHTWRRLDDKNMQNCFDRYLSLKKYKKYEEALWDPNAQEKDILVLPNKRSAVRSSDWFTESDEDSDDPENDPEFDPDDPEQAVTVQDLGWLTGKHWSPVNLRKRDDPNIYSLWGKDLKVIVKLANIILTPENPVYSGGSWHVEAMMNERIVSTGIYYYDQENISDSSLAFRQTSKPITEFTAVADVANQVYGMGKWGPSVQILGSVETKKNRMIAFPNVFHHRVSPFRLRDATKPGHRKILVFFLCDPNEPDIISTSTIAPQQKGETALRDAVLRRTKQFGRLPEEVFQQIMGYIPHMSRKFANEARIALMTERNLYNSNDNKITGISLNL